MIKKKYKITFPEAIVFDCYKTLFENSEEDWIKMFENIVQELHLPIAKEELWRRWKSYEVNFRKNRTNINYPEKDPVFKSYRQAWAECFLKVFEDIEIKADHFYAAEKAVIHMSNRPIFPETEAALANLGNTVKLGLFSNADEDSLNPLLKNSFLKFDQILSSEKARVYKPSPYAFRRIYKELNVEPKRAWYIGDHLYDDVTGSRHVGSTSIWINRDTVEYDTEIKPDIVIKDLMEVSELLNNTPEI
tara:strand:- start:4040 stop:4780 length:741 start_codon:yes stop_codon:yes gene_type:complete